MSASLEKRRAVSRQRALREAFAEGRRVLERIHRLGLITERPDLQWLAYTIGSSLDLSERAGARAEATLLEAGRFLEAREREFRGPRRSNVVDLARARARIQAQRASERRREP